MTNTNRFTLFVGGLGVSVLLTAFILNLCGNIDFTVLNYTNLPPTLEMLISFGLFYINIWVMQAFAGKKSFSKPLITTLVCFISATIIPVEYGLLVTTIFPSIILMNLNGRDANFIRKVSLFLLVTLLFQWMFKTIKLDVFSIEVTPLNQVSILIVSIDLFLFYIFLLKGVRDNVEVLGLVAMFRIISERKNIRKNSEIHITLTKTQLAVKRLVQLVYFSFQLIVILALGQLNNLLAEMVLLIIIFIVGRSILGNSWHSNKLSLCFAISTIGFYAINKITLPFNLSLFVTIAISSAFTYMMYVIGNRADRLDYLEEKYNEDFTKYGLSKRMSEFAYDYKVKGLSIKEQATKTGLSEQVVKNYRTNVNKAILHFNDL